jgi:ABC-2 type transport system ATP-binding protein
MSNQALEIKNLTKVFIPPLSLGDLARFHFKRTSLTALRNISFSLEKGRILGILGPNGSGKTTLLKIIATLILPDEGTVAVGGYRLGEDDKKIKALIGLVTSEERSFYWRLSGLQNLEFFATLYGLSREQITLRIKQHLDLFGITYENKRFDAYSSGMKRKFAIIRALLHKPEIVLFDEPTRSLDYKSFCELQSIIKDIAKREKTVIFATHNLKEAQDLCNIFMILDKGILKGIGTLDELRKEVEDGSASLSEIYLKLTGHVE